jgi:membrane dipeptidase
MKRRDFVRNVAVAGATAGLVGATKPWAAMASQLDESDRSPGRDPMAILRSTIVCDGKSSGPMNETYLKKLKSVGYNCHVSGGRVRFPDEMMLVTTVREIQQAYKKDKIAQVYGPQDAHFLGTDHNRSRGDPRPPLAEYYEKGLRQCGICYNVADMYGAGGLEGHIPLTRAGRRLVEEIHKLGVVLDVGGHTGEQTSLDAIEIAPEIPVCDSHTNVKALNNNPRCDSDRVIEAIAKTGGVIGLATMSSLMSRNPTNHHLPNLPPVGLDTYLDQFDYVRKLVGVDHVGLGTDNITQGLADKSRKDENPAIKSTEIYNFIRSYVKDFEGMEGLPNVVRGLIKRGWSTGEIRKVMGGNWIRVWKKVWGA